MGDTMACAPMAGRMRTTMLLSALAPWGVEAHTGLMNKYKPQVPGMWWGWYVLAAAAGTYVAWKTARKLGTFAFRLEKLLKGARDLLDRTFGAPKVAAFQDGIYRIREDRELNMMVDGVALATKQTLAPFVNFGLSLWNAMPTSISSLARKTEWLWAHLVESPVRMFEKASMEYRVALAPVAQRGLNPTKLSHMLLAYGLVVAPIVEETFKRLWSPGAVILGIVEIPTLACGWSAQLLLGNYGRSAVWGVMALTRIHTHIAFASIPFIPGVLVHSLCNLWVASHMSWLGGGEWAVRLPSPMRLFLSGVVLAWLTTVAAFLYPSSPPRSTPPPIEEGTAPGLSDVWAGDIAGRPGSCPAGTFSVRLITAVVSQAVGLPLAVWDRPMMYTPSGPAAGPELLLRSAYGVPLRVEEGVYPVILPWGHLIKPSRAPSNDWAAFAFRIAKIPEPVDARLVGRYDRAGEAVVKWFTAQFPPTLGACEVLSVEDYILRFTSWKGRAYQRTYINICNGVADVRTTGMEKQDETIALKVVEMAMSIDTPPVPGTLSSRFGWAQIGDERYFCRIDTVVTVIPRALAIAPKNTNMQAGPYILAAMEQFKVVFDETPLIGPAGEVRWLISTGRDPEEMNELLAKGRMMAWTLHTCGDDMYGTLPDQIELDVRMADMLQGEWARRLEVAGLKHLGVPEEVQELMGNQFDDALTWRHRDGWRLRVRRSPQRLTGGVDTSWGVTFVLGSALIFLVVHGCPASRLGIELQATFGILVKWPAHAGPPTFLRSWVVPTEIGPRLMRLPSAVLKAGKILSSPQKLFGKQALNKAAFALAMSLNDFPPNYPLVGALRTRLAELAVPTKKRVTSESYLKVPIEPVTWSCDRVYILAAIEARYGISQNEIVRAEALIMAAVPPAVIVDPVFDRLSQIDYDIEPF